MFFFEFHEVQNISIPIPLKRNFNFSPSTFPSNPKKITRYKNILQECFNYFYDFVFCFSFREIIESLASGEINFYAVEYLNSRWESKDRSEQQKSRTVDLNETKRKCLIHNAMGDFIGNDAAIKHFLTSCI